MPTPQAIRNQTGPNEYHLEYRLKAGVKPEEIIKALSHLWSRCVSAIQDPSLSGHIHYPRGFTSLVVGFNPVLWQTLNPGQLPPTLHPFAGVTGINGKTAPATQADLWIWLNGAGQSVLFDAARDVTARLSKITDVALEQPCFVYHDGLTFEGFMDTTATTQSLSDNSTKVATDAFVLANSAGSLPNAFAVGSYVLANFQASGSGGPTTCSSVPAGTTATGGGSGNSSSCNCSVSCVPYTNIVCAASGPSTYTDDSLTGTWRAMESETTSSCPGLWLRIN